MRRRGCRCVECEGTRRVVYNSFLSVRVSLLRIDFSSLAVMHIRLISICSFGVPAMKGDQSEAWTIVLAKDCLPAHLYPRCPLPRDGLQKLPLSSLMAMCARYITGSRDRWAAVDLRGQVRVNCGY